MMDEDEMTEGRDFMEYENGYEVGCALRTGMTMDHIHQIISRLSASYWTFGLAEGVRGE